MNYRNYILTQSSIVIIFDEKMVPINSANPLYNKIKDRLDRNDLENIGDLVDLASRIRRHTNGKFDVVDGQIVLGNEIMPEALSKRILQFCDAGEDITPLINFWNNLVQNSSEESKKDLYAFMEHNHIPLTMDGCFIAYKRVGENFKDLYSGKFDNSVGAVVEMPREDVDPDRNVTCSKGLHVAAYSYAKNMYNNGQLLEVKVNPKDVVAVPTDYNQEKMRCCKYEVVRVTDGPREELVYEYDSSYNTNVPIQEDISDTDGVVDDADDDWYDEDWESDNCI